MAKRGLGGRRSELEEKYFGERDQKLLTAMREEAAKKAKKAALMDATGIADEELVDQLHELEMCHETVPALSLVPLIVVAWADGFVHADELQVILEAADQEGLSEGHPGREMLKQWLEERPDPKLLEVWKRYVAALSKTLDPEIFDSSKQKALGQALVVAEAAGGILGFGKVPKAERAVLADLEQAYDGQV
jgi:hypothetical protein